MAVVIETKNVNLFRSKVSDQRLRLYDFTKFVLESRKV